MIIDSAEGFISQAKDNWRGRRVSVTKTVPTPDIFINIEDIRLLPWDQVDKPIRCRYPEGGTFLVVDGTDGADHRHKPGSKRLVIRVDGGTVFDIRENRLVLLSDEEVIQFLSV